MIKGIYLNKINIINQIFLKPIIGYTRNKNLSISCKFNFFLSPVIVIEHIERLMIFFGQKQPEHPTKPYTSARPRRVSSFPPTFLFVNPNPSISGSHHRRGKVGRTGETTDQSISYTGANNGSNIVAKD